ncbi:hypothetical protein JMJ77_0002510, partial [Colletotrichum scovillei]
MVRFPGLGFRGASSPVPYGYKPKVLNVLTPRHRKTPADRDGCIKSHQSNRTQAHGFLELDGSCFLESAFLFCFSPAQDPIRPDST